MSRKQAVPPMKVLDQNLADQKHMFVLSKDEGYDVYSWSPGAAGAGVPATQVHLVLGVPVAPGLRVILRLKSARALDELVGVLLQHRKDVWGE